VVCSFETCAQAPAQNASAAIVTRSLRMSVT
jgi:hypothetical protein